MAKLKVGMLTAGGLAPCLSSAVGGLIERYSEIEPDVEVICYLNGYKGLLLGDSITVPREAREKAYVLHKHGGSPIGNSRVKLTNVKDCVERGLVKEGEDPLKVAADRLVTDEVNVLHTIGGDDTNTTAASLAAYLKENDYDLTVVGLPKTVDNDVFPIKQTLGAWTAAEQSAIYFENVVAEHSANPRMLIIHEIMGRNCGWLTAAAAMVYRQRLGHLHFMPELGLDFKRKDVHAIYVPEMEIDIKEEAKRLRKIMDENDGVNIFVSEGAGVESIVKEMESVGEDVPRDAFGHIKLDAVNPGKWFGNQFAEMIDAEKILVQKSGYFARSAPANDKDLLLIKSCVDYAVDSAFRGVSGVVGHDEDHKNQLRAIEFERIAGGKPFNINEEFFVRMLESIGQPLGKKIK